MAPRQLLVKNRSRVHIPPLPPHPIPPLDLQRRSADQSFVPLNPRALRLTQSLRHPFSPPESDTDAGLSTDDPAAECSVRAETLIMYTLDFCLMLRYILLLVNP